MRKLIAKLFSNKKDIPRVPDKIWHDPEYFFAFGLGSGALPIAPGTFGTLLAIPFYLVLRPLPLYAYLIFVVLFIAVASWVSDRVSRDIHVHDHPAMNIDEFVGFFVTMIAAPHGWGWIVLGFVLFRLLDILKPWPINYLDENIKGGFGMILDDVVSGLIACGIIQILKFI